MNESWLNDDKCMNVCGLCFRKKSMGQTEVTDQDCIIKSPNAVYIVYTINCQKSEKKQMANKKKIEFIKVGLLLTSG